MSVSDWNRLMNNNLVIVRIIFIFIEIQTHNEMPEFKKTVKYNSNGISSDKISKGNT